MESIPKSLQDLMGRFGDIAPHVRERYEKIFQSTRAEQGPDFLFGLASKLHKSGENLLALLVLDRAGPDPGEQLNIEKYLGLMLLKIRVLHGLHNYDQARLLAETMSSKIAEPNAELIGNLASVIKSQAVAAGNNSEKEAYLRESMTLYSLCFSRPEFSDSFWLGVNALAIGVCLREFEFVRANIGTVRSACSAALQKDPNDFWIIATLAELKLIELLAEEKTGGAAEEEMLELYQHVEASCSDLQQRKSARKNIGLMLSALEDHDPSRIQCLAEKIDKAFRPTRVVVFSGHRIDSDTRESPRFPASQADKAREAIMDWFVRHPADLGIASAANGGDIIFLDLLLQTGRAAHVILPFDETQFREHSVSSDSPEDNWFEQYDQLIAGTRAGAVIWHATQSYIDPDFADAYYDHTNKIILGMSLLKAQELDAKISGLALLVPEEDHSAVGTMAAVQLWQSHGLPIDYWSPQTEQWLQLEDAKDVPPKSAPESLYVSRTILFADVIGFSKLSERAITGFCEGVLTAVSQVRNQSLEPPIEMNTWGDGIFAVFETATGATDFALALCELMETNNQNGYWERQQLPSQMAMRVSLHSAPVQQLTNPLTGLISHWGQNVNVAARIEPITPPNQVYASASTAALMAAEGGRAFRADFVGMVPLAKNFGTLEIFRIRR